MRERAARVAGALSPLVLGVALACIQLFPPTTMTAIGTDQVRTGRKADLTVISTGTGVGADTIERLRALPEVASVEPVVSSSVAVLAPHDGATWQTLPTLGVEADPVAYADLHPGDGGDVTMRSGEVAVGAYAAAMLAVDEGDRIKLARPDGSIVERRVTAIYDRDLGFGQAVLPIADLLSATVSGRPTGASIRLTPGALTKNATDAVAATLRDRPGLSVSASPVVADAEPASGEGSLQLMLLITLFGYIAVAVANSVVVTTLARRREFSMLRVIGTTPKQLSRIARVEGLFLAAAACVIGTVAAVPGLISMTSELSHGAMTIPSIEPSWYAGILVATFALAVGATSCSRRVAMRKA